MIVGVPLVVEYQRGKQLIGCGVTEKFIGEIHSERYVGEWMPVETHLERYVGEWMPGRGLSPISRGMDL